MHASQVVYLLTELISSPWVTALEVTIYDLGSIAFGMSSSHDGGRGEEWGHLRKADSRKRKSRCQFPHVPLTKGPFPCD